MNTQDPYRDLSAMKRRKEYPGYDDFVPYRSDWRYSLGIFSVLMIVGIALGYWKLQSTALGPIAPAKVITGATAPVKTPVTVKQPTAMQSASEIKSPAMVARPKTAVKQKKDDNQPSTSKPQEKPAPMKPVTGPPTN
jgi:hypothetical protein